MVCCAHRARAAGSDGRVATRHARGAGAPRLAIRDQCHFAVNCVLHHRCATCAERCFKSIYPSSRHEKHYSALCSCIMLPLPLHRPQACSSMCCATGPESRSFQTSRSGRCIALQNSDSVNSAWWLIFACIMLEPGWNYYRTV